LPMHEVISSLLSAPAVLGRLAGLVGGYFPFFGALCSRRPTDSTPRGTTYTGDASAKLRGSVEFCEGRARWVSPMRTDLLSATRHGPRRSAT
jgi:hypothetical protein